jgi:hypothetical protein
MVGFAAVVSGILAVVAGVSVDGLTELRSLAARALRAGTARFRLAVVISELGSDPIHEHVGFVDFRRRSYDGGAQRVIDGVVYGRDEAGVWTCLELGSREPIGPVWMLDLLTGATSVASVAQGPPTQAGARSVEGVANLLAARRVTGRSLDGVGGAPRSSMRAVPVSAVIGADGLARRVTAEVHDHSLSCEFWDYGAEELITAPSEAVSLQGPSFARSVLRGLMARRPRRRT